MFGWVGETGEKMKKKIEIKQKKIILWISWKVTIEIKKLATLFQPKVVNFYDSLLFFLHVYFILELAK